MKNLVKMTIKQEKELDKILKLCVLLILKISKIFLDIQALEHIREFRDLNMEFG